MTQDITPDTMRQVLKAVDAAPNQDLRSSPIKFNVVDAFDTHFGQWAVRGKDLIVQVFPRAGDADVYYPGRTVSDGRSYVPGRLEVRPQDLSFPGNMLDVISTACHKVTYGDVEYDFVNELGAWVFRFKDIGDMTEWMRPQGLLEQFFEAIDQGLEG